MQRIRNRRALTQTKSMGKSALKEIKETRQSTSKKLLKETKKTGTQPVTSKLMAKKHSQKHKKQQSEQAFNMKRKSLASFPQESIIYFVSPIESNQASYSHICEDQTIEMLIKDMPF